MTSTTRARKGATTPHGSRAQLKKMSQRLNYYGALLHGIEEICRSDAPMGNTLEVAAETCKRLNKKMCRMADRIGAMTEEGGAA